MTHLGLYFGCVFGGLFAIVCALAFVARATKGKPKPIKPAWAISGVCLAVLAAGTICSIAGRDIHILYWWLLGAPAVAIGIPLVVVPATLLLRSFIRLIFQDKR